MDRRNFVKALGWLGVVVAFPTAIAQQVKVRRIGFLGSGSRSTPTYDAFLRGLRELGYIDGQNLIIESRFADGEYEPLSDLATELVRRRTLISRRYALSAARQNANVRRRTSDGLRDRRRDAC